MRLISWLREQIVGERLSSSGPSSRIRQRKTHRAPAQRCQPRLEPLEDRCLLTGGVLDPTFGTGGVVISPLGATTKAYAVATYPVSGTTKDCPLKGTTNDCKIVVGGVYAGTNHQIKFGVVRYNLDGSLDNSFGSGGEVAGPASDSFGALDVVVQPDGKILAAGGSNGSFALVRYNADGSLDKTFGSRGVAVTDISANNYDRIRAIALQPDGKIVAVGETIVANTPNREVDLVRYNANGTLDTSFAKAGKALDHILASPPDGSGAMHMALAIDSGTGQIVVQAGSPESVPGFPGAYAAMVLRYTSKGVLDQSFGGSGLVTFDGNRLPALESQSDVAIQPKDHRIVLAGRTFKDDGYPLQTLARLNSDGTLDGSLTVTSIFDASDRDTIKLQSDGRIVVGAGGWQQTLTVARYNPDLSIDTTFGTAGLATVASLGAGESFAGMALEPDGRVVEVGNNSSGNWRVDVARFLATGPQITSFTANPTTPAVGDSVTLSAAALAINPGSTVTQVAFYVDSNGDGALDASDTQLVGTLTQSGGIWTFTFTVPSTWTSGSTYKLFAQATDSYGVLSDPLSLDLQVL